MPPTRGKAVGGGWTLLVVAAGFWREDVTRVDKLRGCAESMAVGLDSAAAQIINYAFPDAVRPLSPGKRGHT